MGRINVTILIFVGTLVPNFWRNLYCKQLSLGLLFVVQGNRRVFGLGFFAPKVCATSSDGHSFQAHVIGDRCLLLRDCTCTGSLL